MATTIPDLWPHDVHIDVLPPVCVLKVQEAFLERKTQGLLRAKVSTTQTEQLVQHQLDLVAPALNFYRVRLLSATHAAEMLYPVTVAAEAFAPQPSDPMEALVASVTRKGEPPVNQRGAATED